MCGIMGYYCFGDKRPSKTKITTMFALLESRGRDSSGVGYIRNGKLVVNKEAVRSSQFVNKPAWQNLELPGIMIAHTRSKTQGTEKNNKNNHPLFNSSGLCIVHNGMIWNDREIFAKTKREAEVDSLAILEVLSRKKDGDRIKRVFEKLHGSFAFAAIDTTTPENLILVKKDNPIDLYYSEYEDILYFCSEREIMQEALMISTSKKRGFSLGEMGFHFFQMKNNRCLIINRDGVESYNDYESSLRRQRFDDDEYYDSFFGGYGKKKEPFEDSVVLQCPYCLEYTRYDPGYLSNKCEHCGIAIVIEENEYV
jgi:glucosamine 6-phosphate synthetase-like amidotransferase/phosphosugar isomerase protein